MKKLTRLLTYSYVLITVITIVLITLTVLYSSVFRTEYDYSLLNENWICKVNNTDVSTQSFPTSISSGMKGYITLIKRLPERIPENAAILFNANYQRISVKINNVARETSQSKGILALSCTQPWTAIPISETDCGKEIEITVISSGSKARTEIYSALLGDINDIKLMLVNENLDILVVCIFMVLLAIVLFICSSLFSRHFNSDNRVGFIPLAFFVISSCLWIFTDSDLQTAFFMGNEAFFLLNLFSYMIMPLPFVVFINRAIKKFKWIVDIICAVYVAFFLITLLTVLFGIFRLNVILTITHFVISLTLAALLFVTGYELFALKNRSLWGIFLGICLFCLLGAIQIVIFYAGAIANNTAFFTYGILLFALILFINAVRRALRSLEYTRSFEMLTETIPSGICKFNFDSSLNIVYANSYFYSMFGYTEEEAEHSDTDSFYNFMNDSDRTYITGMFESAMARKKHDIEFELKQITKDRSIIWTLLHCTVDNSKTVPEITAVIIDINERKNAEEQLRIREEEYRIATLHSDKTIIRYDVSTHDAYCPNNKVIEGILRGLGGNFPYSAIKSGLLSPDSVDECEKMFDKINRGEGEGSGVFCIRRSVKIPWRWFHADFSLIFDKSGVPLQAIISIYDITEQREKEIAFEKWQQSYESMPADKINYYQLNITDDCIEHEDGGMLPPINDASITRISAVAAYIAEYHIYFEDRQQFLNFFSRERMISYYERGIKTDKIVCRRISADGIPMYISAELQLIADPYSSDIKAFILLLNIDEAKRSELLLEARSNEDALTGLYNRNAFINRFEKILTQNPNEHHVLIMVDLDQFKYVNDSLGHQAGDAVLINVANRLKSSLRADDLCGRIGGDEFVICLKDVKYGSALENRIKSICEFLVIKLENHSSVSASLGIAGYPENGTTFDALYQNADMSLYRAKKNGRHCCAFCDNVIITDQNH